MKAAVCYEFGKPLVIEDINIDPPEEGQVKVRMAATAICHSDIHGLRGELSRQLPVVAGHESSGYIEEVGKNVTDLKPGDPVVVSMIASCGRCEYCVTGLHHLCDKEWPHRIQSPVYNKQGIRLENVGKVGSFAEYCIVDQSQAVKIPAGMPMDRAALLGCGVITGFGSVVNRAAVKPMSSVVVIGTGGVGLNSVQGAVFCGAYPIIAVDVVESKLKAAMEFGATHTVNGKQVDPVEEVRKLTGGKGADYVFVTVGHVHSMEQGFEMSGKRGMTVIIGLTAPGEKMAISPFEFIKTERILTGCDLGATRMRIDIPKLIAMYQAGKLKLDELITHRFPLEKINEAIEEVERGEALRNVIMFP